MKSKLEMSLILVIAAFVFRAGFFVLESQSLAAALCIYGLFCLFRARRTPLGAEAMVPLAIAVAYGLSILFAGDTSSAILSAPIMVAATVAPTIVISAKRVTPDWEAWLRRFAAAVVGGSTAAVVFGAVAVSLQLPIVGLLESGRLSVLLEYPNALASLLVVAGFLCIGLIRNDNDKWTLMWWASLGIIGAGLMSTYSRLGLGIALLACLLDGIRAIQKGRLPFELMALGGGVVVGLVLFPAIRSGDFAQTLLWLTVAAGLGPMVFRALSPRLKGKPLLPVITGMLGLTAAALFVLSRGSGFQLALSRISAIQTGWSMRRLAFVLDGGHMFFDRPLFGWGGGFFKYGSLKYRMVPYFTQFVHNHVVQIALETGIVGAVAFVLAGVSLALGTIRWWGASNSRDIPSGELHWSVALAGVSLWAHSLGDFSLSLPAMTLLFWYLYMINESGNPARPLKGPWPRVIKFSVVLILFCGVILSSLNAVGFICGREGARLVQREGASLNAMRQFELAAVFSPLSADYRIDLAQVLMAYGEATRNLGMAERALVEGHRAVELSPLDPRVRTVHALQLAKMGRLSEAIGQMETLVKNDPFGPNGYETLTRLYSETAQLAARASNMAEAKDHGRKAAEVPGRMKSVRDSNQHIAPQYGVTELEPRETDVVRLYAGIGAIYAGLDARARDLLEAITAADLRNDALVWRTVLAGLSREASYDSRVQSLPPQLSSMVKQLVNLGRP